MLSDTPTHCGPIVAALVLNHYMIATEANEQKTS